MTTFERQEEGRGESNQLQEYTRSEKVIKLNFMMTRLKRLFGVVDSCFVSNKVISVECFVCHTC